MQEKQTGQAEKAHVSSLVLRAAQDSSPETKKLKALQEALRRICCPKKGSGKLEVSPEIHKQFMQGGEPRKGLLRLLIKSGGDKEPGDESLQFMLCFWPPQVPVLRVETPVWRGQFIGPILPSFDWQESFKKTITHIQKKSKTCKITVESGYYSKKAMKDDLKFNQSASQKHIYLYTYVYT